MKKLIIILFILFVGEEGFGQDKESFDLKYFNLNGQIKTIKTTYYYGADSNSFIRTFDTNGNLIEESDYNNDVYNGKSIWLFNDKGFLIEKKEFDLKNEILLKTIWNYTKEKKLVEKFKLQQNDNLLQKFTFLYDDKNNIKESILFSNEWAVCINEMGPGYIYKTIDSVSARFIFKYDLKRNKTEEIEHDSKGRIIGKKTFKFDSNNNLVSKKEYGSNNKLWRELNYIYDRYSNKIEQNEPNLSRKLEWKFTMKYDNHKNVIERFYYSRKNGSLLLQQKNSFQYKFDEKENWVLKTITGSNEFIKREIKYY